MDSLCLFTLSVTGRRLSAGRVEYSKTSTAAKRLYQPNTLTVCRLTTATLPFLSHRVESIWL